MAKEDHQSCLHGHRQSRYQPWGHLSDCPPGLWSPSAHLLRPVCGVPHPCSSPEQSGDPEELQAVLVWFMGEKPAEDPSHCLQGLGFTCQEGCPQAPPHSLQEKQDPRVGMCPTHVFFLIYICMYWAVRGLCCGMWDLVPCPKIEPRSPALGARSLTHWTTREVPPHAFLTHTTSLCQKQRCRLKAQVSFIFLIKDAQHTL